MHMKKSLLAAALTLAVAASAVPAAGIQAGAAATKSIESQMNWDTVTISGGGFVSGLITGEKNIYARTDVGGAYRYNPTTKEWEQLMAFFTDADRGFLSVDAMALDPNDDNIVYALCGCAYFSDARTAVFRSKDGGKTWDSTDVTNLIQVHGNGYGRQCGESIAVDPDDPNTIYCGGDTVGMIVSHDAGVTWEAVDSFNSMGLFTNEIKWPTWTENVVKTTVGADYVNCNGISTIAIEKGKVYVGISDNTLECNMYVADVDGKKWEPLSKDLPANKFPSRITKDNAGNLLICYVGGLTFNGTGGGIYKYNTTTGEVTNISPTENSFGACMANPKNNDQLIATTCGVWSTNRWSEEDGAWGDWLYRSEDGGKTWTEYYPGKMGEYKWNAETGEMVQEQVIDYLDANGCSWVYGKAIHWSGSLIINPKDFDQIMVSSGNGIFKWDGIWGDSPKASFCAQGIEEVVALDMTSVPGGAAYSAIGDYDGFIHTDVDKPATQYVPNMGSTGAIAYCPQNPKVMVRIAENQNDIAPGFYSTDGGKTWTKMANSAGGKAAITQLDKDTYRIFLGKKDSGDLSYSDDWGQTWNACTGIGSAYGSKPTYTFVEPNDPSTVYAYATYYNSSWHYSKKEPELSDANYTLYISTDYGKTFTGTQICMYDQCDSAGRIASLEDNHLILAGGWYGLYDVKTAGSKAEVTKKDVFYCKTVGYGAPEKKGGINTLYMYGKPQETDIEGIYRSTDGGDSWVCINTQKLYGGTGNGNFLVGDMNTFGTVYMSTVGCGIVVGRLSGGTENPDILYGDVNANGIVDIADTVLLARYIAQDPVVKITKQGLQNADCDPDGNIDSSDLTAIARYLAHLVDKLG